MTSVRNTAKWSIANWVSVTALLLGAAVLSSPAEALTLTVQEVGGGSITDFSYLVNVDNTGDPSHSDPAMHPGMHPMASYSPIVAAGDETTPTILGADGNPLPAGNCGPDGNDACRYLISVRADGYKLWGQHFRLPGAPATLVVELQPEPLPLSNLVVHVFHDFAPPDGFPNFSELPGGADGPCVPGFCEPPPEVGMDGFHIVVKDVIGEVTVDFDGNPICGDGVCLTDVNGDLTIPNLGFGKYLVCAVPPDGTDWVQTTTFEGGEEKCIDAWLEEGTDGNGAPGEILVEAGVFTANFFGFTTSQFDDLSCGANCESIQGTARNFVTFPPFEQTTFGEPVKLPWVTLTDIGNTDRQVKRIRGNASGFFNFPSVPPGSYQVAIWDDALEYIMIFYTVNVDPLDGVSNNIPGGDPNGNVGIFRWFGFLAGNVFLDSDQDGIRDGGEVGIGNIDLYIKNRDGSLSSGTFTNNTNTPKKGYFEFPEARGPLGRFQVHEVGAGRFKWTGMSLHDEQFANYNLLDPSPTPIPGDLGGDLLLNHVTWEGKRSFVDWGKVPWLSGQNGGIAGATFYATTRNEFDARLAAAEDYEPGLPNVRIRMWSLGADGIPSNADDELLNEIQSDAWGHPSTEDPSPPDYPQSCDVRRADGTTLAGPTQTMISDDCIEVPQMGNESKDGAWDGGWAITESCPTGLLRGTVDVDTDGNGINQLDEEAPLVADMGAFACGFIPPGDYLVQAVPPPFYQIVAEEDQNTDEGSGLIPLIPPPPCAGDLHLVVDARNPFNGQMKPLCDWRRVTVQNQQNAAAEFYFFTDLDTNPTTKIWSGDKTDPADRGRTDAVPIPGRFFGLVEDDIVINPDVNALNYGEKIGVPNIPIRVADYTQRAMTTIFTDENGYYEVLLPSTFTAFCPIPSGVCAEMYMLIVNDPGTDPAVPNPGFSVSYFTEPAVRDVWPGKMTPTDTPVDPINALVCSVPPNTPQIFRVSQVETNTLPVSITITGTRFGNLTSQPTVTLDDDDGVEDPVTLAITSWTPATPFASPPVFEDVVTVQVPASLGSAPGPYQLNVTNNEPGGSVNANGITFHILGGTYTPAVVTVNPPANPDTPVIQTAINTAPAGSLIVINPGTYRENVIMDKPVILQGFGPGGIVGGPNVEPPDPPCNFPEFCPPTTVPGEEPFAHIPGSVIDGRFFHFVGAKRDAWIALENATPYSGPAIDETQPGAAIGAAITILAEGTATGGEFSTGLAARIDGLGITGGRGGAGGGVYSHAFVRRLTISNNIFEANEGAHGGAISLGRSVPDGGLGGLTVGDGGNQNDDNRILFNRVLGNGGLHSAGAIGIFNGADSYDFGNNDVCGNFALEYGAGFSHWGYSPNGHIHDNRIYFNDATDEGGGMMIAGDSGAATPLGIGTGPLVIERNLLQANLSRDDGGGIEVLRALNFDIDIVNNMIVNNAAQDFGGGLTLDESSQVTLVNNTISGNVSTSVAEDSVLGTAHGAGLVSERHGGFFLSYLELNDPSDDSTFSNPVMFNNFFWDNLACHYEPTPDDPGDPEPDTNILLCTIGVAGPSQFIDLEVFNGSPGECLDPRFSILSVDYGADSGSCTTTDPSNIVLDPAVGDTGTDLFVRPLRADRLEVMAQANRFAPAEIVLFMDRPEGTLVGWSDNHLQTTPPSPAVDAGTGVDPIAGVVAAPGDDFDRDIRPFGLAFDIGADESTGAPPPVPVAQLFFSTAGNTAVPGVASPYDDADIYKYSSDGTFGRLLDATAVGFAGSADIDALKLIDGDTFYLSFNTDAGTQIPGPVGLVQDEDVVRFDAGTWTIYFDGSDVGLSGATDVPGEDVDAFEILADGSIIVSTGGGVSVPGLAGTHQDEDVLRCAGTFTAGTTDAAATTTCTWSMYFDATDVALNTSGTEDVDGVNVFGGNMLLSTLGAFTVNGGLSGDGSDVFRCSGRTTTPGGTGGFTSSCSGGFSMFFDGSAKGLVAGTNIDAFQSMVDPAVTSPLSVVAQQ